MSGGGGPHIRPGRDDDAPGFIALIGACWGEYPGVEVDVPAEVPEIHALASHVAGQGGALWTVEQDGRVVGMTATYPDGAAWTLSRVYLDAGLRGTGLGQRLLRLAEDHARNGGADRLVLWSDVLFTRAHAFYEKHGLPAPRRLACAGQFVEHDRGRLRQTAAWAGGRAGGRGRGRKCGAGARPHPPTQRG